MKVSVIIPTYNEQDSIGDSLKSLAQQTHKDMEVIVVNDGSTDNSKFKIQNSKLQFKIKNLTLLEQRHKGAGAARNLGAKEARGEILVFVDADMTFEPDFIEKLVAPIIAGRTIGTFSKEEFVQNKENIWARCWSINRGLPYDRMHPKDYPDTQPVFRAIKRFEFERAGGFDEKAGYTDDWTLSEKLGVKAVVAEGAKFYHRNPGLLREVFAQSRWMAKRKYKFGLLGGIYGLFRVSFPTSLAVGAAKALWYQQPAFLPFKLASDFGSFLGIIEFLLLGRVAK